jgi:AcrR family transcriptional regulator
MAGSKTRIGVRVRAARTDANRERVLDAAERLLRDGPDFSMRELAAEAGVSFATPFNQFGSKTAIAQALSARRIAAMIARLEQAPGCADAVGRVLAAVEIAVGVLLEDGAASRSVIGSLGMPTGAPGAVAADSRELWSMALDGLTGIDPDLAESASAHLPGRLALMFRGCLSFWAAGEIADADLLATARGGAATILLAFASPARRAALWSAAGP